ncbi:MAG: hypothetical protein ACO2OY_08205 [Thermodesulfobacteriaceae bacterium]
MRKGIGGLFKKLASDERWLLLSNLAVFLIFTLANARRGYFNLAHTPFCSPFDGYLFTQYPI